MGPQLKASSDRQEKPEIEPVYAVYPLHCRGSKLFAISITKVHQHMTADEI